MHEQLSDARKQAASILKAEPFDKEKYLAQVQHVNELRVQISQKTTQSVATLAAQFTPEERAILAEIISAHPQHGREGKQHREE